MVDYEQLYAENKGLLIRCAYKHAAALAHDPALDVDDLVQAGFFGLVEAQKAYKPDGGKSWPRFASWYIYKELQNLTHFYNGRLHTLDQTTVSLDAPIGEDENGDTLRDMVADTTLSEAGADLELRELRAEVRRAVDALPTGFQRAVIREVYYNGHTRRETGEILGATASQLSIAENQIRKRFKRDARLIRLAELNDLTRFHKHKGVAAFNRDLTSVTEGEALRRIELEEEFGLYRANRGRPEDDAE